MNRELWTLVFEGVRRKKRSSLLIFFVLWVSFGFAVMSVSLVGSMSRTNREYTLDMYGEWLLAIPAGLEEDEAWLRAPEQNWVEQLGITRSYGQIQTTLDTFGFGTMDEEFIQLGRITLEDGRWPQSESEIVMEGSLLNALGCDYTLGQQISLPVQLNSGETVVQNYTLCGILREYTRIWALEQNRSMRPLVGAVVTPAAAEQLLDAAKQSTPQQLQPIPQYFIRCPADNYISYSTLLSMQMKLTQDQRVSGDTSPSANRAIVQTNNQTELDTFYLNLIAAVAAVSVLCIYVLQLPSDLRSLATLRSIGGTRGQLAGLLLAETALIFLPAAVLGVPLGAAGTWLALQAAVYAGSMPVHLDVPFVYLGKVLLIWAGAVLLARLLTLGLLLRVPLAGRIQLQGRWAHWVRRLQSGLLVVLLAAFAGLSLFTAYEIQSPLRSLETLSDQPFYSVISLSTPFTPEQVQKFENLPGLTTVPTAGDGILKARLSFPGLDEREVYLYVLDNEDWADIFDLSEGKEAFQAGELVYLCLPEEPTILDIAEYPFLADPPLPEGEVTLSYYATAGTHYELTDEMIAQTHTKAKIQYVPALMRGLAFSTPYTVVCSQAYMEDLLAQMPSGQQWGRLYQGGGEFGYTCILFLAEPDAVSIGTDQTLAQLCRQTDSTLTNNRQYQFSLIQKERQTIAMLAAVFGCVSVILLALSASILAMEAERERRSKGILRALGMTRWQNFLRTTGKGFFRSVLALVVGGVGCAGYLLYRYQGSLDWMKNEYDLEFSVSAIEYLQQNFERNGFDSRSLLLWGVSILAILTVLSVGAKLRPIRNLPKEWNAD